MGRRIGKEAKSITTRETPRIDRQAVHSQLIRTVLHKQPDADCHLDPLSPPGAEQFLDLLSIDRLTEHQESESQLDPFCKSAVAFMSGRLYDAPQSRFHV